MKIFRKIILIIGFILLVIIVALTYWKIEKSRAVQEHFEIARKALHEAAISEASLYSTGLYDESLDLYESAMKAWNRENKRFFLWRNYSPAEILAEQSAVVAGKAKDFAMHHYGDLKGRIKSEQDRLRSEIGKNREFISVLPINDNARYLLSQGMLKLAESEAAYQSGRYIMSWEKLEEAEKNIRTVMGRIDGMLEDYFSHYDDWRKWIEQSLEHSASQHSTVIVVDKTGRTANVYRNGLLCHSFTIEMGENWIGDKRMKGDKATPEGFYSIVEKKQQSQTRYHKALLLDYPNMEDVRRFRQNKQKGIIADGSDMGGAIEIHGMGGRGIDWTDGCIALKNQDMEILFDVVRTGTPVIIVGSSRPLAEVWK